MSKQIFKSAIPKGILVELLDKICNTSDTVYMIDSNAYKRMKFHNYHIEFLSTIIEHYHWSKRFYVEREFTYQSFANILRQICRLHAIPISSDIRYSESTYAIQYFINKPIQ
jgi:hypothetical protein